MAPRIPPDQVSPHARKLSGAIPPRQFLTGPQVCARYSITDMSLWRWLKDPEIAFPQPAMVVKERRYWLEEDLVVWERARLPSGDEAMRDERKHKPRGRRTRAAAASMTTAST
jgi:predicted DNA-binding transcriptional regulator AlpA